MATSNPRVMATIDPWLLWKVLWVCKKRNISKSQLMKESLLAYLGEDDIKQLLEDLPATPETDWRDWDEE